MKKVYFVSDAHFGSRGLEDSRANERKFLRWIDAIRPDCAALYLLGDMIDFWFEYKRLVPKGYTRFFGKLAELTDSGIPVYWFCGNHDLWLFHYVQEELGIQVCREPLLTEIGGKRFFLAHGDGLGDPDKGVRCLQKIFHSCLCQWMFSHLIPSNWAMALGTRWSHHSFEKRKRQGGAVYSGENQECLVRFAKDYLKAHPEDKPDFFIFGHRHIMLDLMLSASCRLLIAGDWMQAFSYIAFDGEELALMQFESE